MTRSHTKSLYVTGLELYMSGGHRKGLISILGWICVNSSISHVLQSSPVGIISPSLHTCSSIYH